MFRGVFLSGARMRRFCLLIVSSFCVWVRNPRVKTRRICVVNVFFRHFFLGGLILEYDNMIGSILQAGVVLKSFQVQSTLLQSYVDNSYSLWFQGFEEHDVQHLTFQSFCAALFAFLFCFQC